MPFEVINSNKNDEHVAAYAFRVGTTHHEELPDSVITCLEKVKGLKVKKIDKMPETEKKSEALELDSSETPEGSDDPTIQTPATPEGPTPPQEFLEIEKLPNEKAKEKIGQISDLSLLGLIAAKANTKGKQQAAEDRAKQIATA